MASFGIIRMAKFQISDVQGIQKHNQRQGKSKSNTDIDYEKTEQNYDFLNQENIQYERVIKKRIDKKVKRKPRANSVVLSEFVVTASPQYMNALSENEQKKYFAAGTDFIQKKYGAENVIYAMVHNDESTPHLHVGITPITKDGRLSAKDIFNGKQAMVRLQDEFHQHMVEHGFEIERGEASDRQNVPTAEFKKQTLEKEIEKLALHHQKGKVRLAAELKRFELAQDLNKKIEKKKESEGFETIVVPSGWTPMPEVDVQYKKRIRGERYEVDPEQIENLKRWAIDQKEKKEEFEEQLKVKDKRLQQLVRVVGTQDAEVEQLVSVAMGLERQEVLSKHERHQTYINRLEKEVQSLDERVDVLESENDNLSKWKNRALDFMERIGVREQFDKFINRFIKKGNER